jgi:hypothetical protein
VIARSFPRRLLTFASIKRGETNGSLGTKLVAFVRVGAERMPAIESGFAFPYRADLRPAEPFGRFYGPLKRSAPLASTTTQLHLACVHGACTAVVFTIVPISQRT